VGYMKCQNLLCPSVAVAMILCFAVSGATDDSLYPKVHAEMLDCGPIDTSWIDPSMPRTVLKDLELFTNTMFVWIVWQPVDTIAADYYYIQASTSPLFPTTDDCKYVSISDSSACMFTSIEDAIWYRILVANTKPPIAYGLPSTPPIYTIFDITKPKLTITVTPIPTVGGGRPQVRVDFDGVELYPASLILSEDTAFNHAQSFPIEASSGTKILTLSYDEERKVIYGKMIDKAGNASNVAADTISAGSRSHNYPNPFNPKQGPTNLVFYLTDQQAGEEIMVFIYDLFGNLVKKRRVDSPRTGANDGGESANTSLQWDGCNQDGMTVADGGYICVIKAGDEMLSRHKIAVAK